MDLGIATVAAITALVYVIGLVIKNTKIGNRWIPAIAGISGVVLGVLAFYLDVPDFPASDVLTAAAVGAVSGLAATGIDQIGKQLKYTE